MRAWKKLLMGLGGGAVMVGVTCLGVAGPCWSAWWSYGVVEWTCPAGVMPYLSVETSALGRGVKGTVSVNAIGQLYDEQLNPTYTSPVRRFSPVLSLVKPDGTEVPLEPERRWKSPWAGRKYAEFFLPKDLPDDDYLLRVRAKVPSGETTLDVALPLYRPALEHVVTDAPLYRAGQTVKARAVLLQAGSLAPLDDRPGRWKVWDPSGELVMEEKARTLHFGATGTTFPLAPDAPPGMWAIGFESGALTTRHEFEVREYRLPRFLVTLEPTERWYGEGGHAIVEGTARYTSGAPVQQAAVALSVSASGAWPPPNEWLENRVLQTDREGKFKLDLGAVPDDLVGKVTLGVYAQVTDETGETGAGSASVLLSEDAITVEAVTELEGGLVPDANNRLYLRVTTPDGKPLPGVKVKLRREWDGRDPGLEAETDADAVAKFQFDPGQPVTVTEPALPVRPAAADVPVRLVEITDEVTGNADLALSELGDKLAVAFRPCANLVDAREAGVAYLRAGPGGVSALWTAEFTPVVRDCLRDGARGARLRGGEDRVVNVSFALTNPGVSTVNASVSLFAGNDEGVSEAFTDAARAARACVAGAQDGGELPSAWTFVIPREGISPRLSRVGAEGDDEVARFLPCIERAFSAARTEDAVSEEVAGLLTASVYAASSSGSSWTSPPSWPGFAFVASVAEQGKSTLRMPVGAVPSLRLRFSEVVVDPGAEIELTALRGPDFYGDLPKEMRFVQGDRLLAKFDFDPKKRVGKFVVPGDASGFAWVEWNGARALLYVRPRAELNVALSSEGTWRPGAEASIEVKTSTRAGPVAAGVTLAGVDSAMAAIAPLPAPDDWAKVTVLASSASPAFGILDAKALQTGQVSGDFAAQATVLRVSSLPPSQPGSDNVNTSASGMADVETPLTEAYYGLYAEARKAVRNWEKTAPKDELLTAEKMVKLWESTLRAHPARDPFGRLLHLSVLPQNLLALADPRVMVADAGRLPEDIENWPAYVAEEAP